MRPVSHALGQFLLLSSQSSQNWREWLIWFSNMYFRFNIRNVKQMFLKTCSVVIITHYHIAIFYKINFIFYNVSPLPKGVNFVTVIYFS